MARVSVIGAVENVGNITPQTRPSTLPIADNIIQMASARVAMPSAVGSEVITFPQKRGEKQVHSMPEPQAKAQVAEKSILPKKTVKEDKRLRPANSSPIGRNFASRNWLEWATGAALGAALLGVVFYVTEVRPSSISAAAQKAAPAKSDSHSAPIAPTTASYVAPVSEQTAARGPAPTAPITAAANARPDAIRSIRSRVEPSSPPALELSSIARVHVTGAPAHNFIYPEAPNSTVTGTVNLRALIGPDGLVKHVDVLSGKPALARPAVDAMRHWRYSPPQSDGQAAAAETRVTMNFVGDDAVTVVFPKGDN